jgi:sodium/bile acid cotransporter 7
MKSWIQNIDWFIPALLTTIFIAWLWPEGGTKSGILSVKVLSGIGVSLIFFLYGLRLNLNTLMKSLSNWRLHLLIQATTFLIFPLFALIGKITFGNDGYLWQGIIYLSIMPSTVSSAVVLVSLSNGNVPAAIFNSSFSSIAGVIIAPLMLEFLLFIPGMEFNAANVLFKLILQILIPLLIGVMLNPVFGKHALKYKGFTRYFDQLVILSIVYYSFAQSFHINQFKELTAFDLGLLVLILLGLFLLVNISIYLIAKVFALHRGDLITALFCGSTKSLVHGSTLGRIIFISSASAGVILLPILIYHSLQLFISGFMVTHFNKSSSIVKSNN